VGAGAAVDTVRGAGAADVSGRPVIVGAGAGAAVPGTSVAGAGVDDVVARGAGVAIICESTTDVQMSKLATSRTWSKNMLIAELVNLLSWLIMVKKNIK
jgi:hypothetical protein